MSGPGPAGYYLRSLLRNLGAGARLAFFLPVRDHDFRATPGDFAVLMLFGFLLWIATAVARVGFDGEFDPSAIPVYMAGVLLVLGAALAVATVLGAPERTLLVAVALTSSQPVFHLVALVALTSGAAAALGRALYIAFLAWIWAVALRAVAVSGARQPSKFRRAALVVTLMLALDVFVMPETEPWNPPPEELAADAAPLADERLFHLQGELIEDALAAIQRGTPGKPELYFVGFAPDASQDVFLREMRFVKRLFDERFAAAGRSIALASSYEALEEFPIGSVTNLARALLRVGEAMNPDEDVLFLYLSAHGGEDHRLSASMPPLDLAQLTPTALARMLQDSGIKYRVIVVSACFSGGFIEPLRDENSLIITASAADRTSFGCESGRDFTYFGQAYFRDALSKTRSFVDAFEAARQIVDQEEKAERLTPSLPQIWIGGAIREQLRRQQK